VKAIVVREFGEPDVMKIEDVPVPVISDSEILVKIVASGVNPVDTYLRTGNHAHAPELPYTPGKDAAGVVESVGENVTAFKPGDRVYTSGALTGTYAEFAKCSENQLGLLPANTSFEAGAGIWTPYATSYRGLFQKANIKTGETVLIHGASGGVGIAAIQWAKNIGANVFGTASSTEGLKLAKDQGADQVFDHSKDDHLEQIKEASGGGVNVIVEMLANENLENDFKALKLFGRIVIIGNRGSLRFTPRLAMTKDVTIYGMSLFNAPTDAMKEIHKAIFEGLEKGYLAPVVNRLFPLSEAPQAHSEIIDKKAYGKIILKP
jgi:NADPH2:quinone reductase